MPKLKKEKSEAVDNEPVVGPSVQNPGLVRYNELLSLYETLKKEGIQSISELENMIAKLKRDENIV